MRRVCLCVFITLAVLLAAWLVMQAQAGAPGMVFPALGAWEWPGELCEMVSYVVGQGDTLWAIARRYYPDVRTDAAVWAIRVENDLTGPEGPILRPGQEIWIPDPMLYGVGRR